MSTRQPDLYACLLNAAILKECTIHPFCFYGASTAMDIPLLPDIVAIFCLSIGVPLDYEMMNCQSINCERVIC